MESTATGGPLETVIPSCLYGRVSSPLREETTRGGSLDQGLSIIPEPNSFNGHHDRKNYVILGKRFKSSILCNVDGNAVTFVGTIGGKELWCQVLDF